MTSPDPVDHGRAPWHPTPDEDVSLAVATPDLNGSLELDGAFDSMTPRGICVDRLALALLLIAVFVAVPLGLLVLQAA